MPRTYQALAAAVFAVVVLGAAGCSGASDGSGGSGGDKRAGGENGSGSADGSGADGSRGDSSAKGDDGKGSSGKRYAPSGVERLSAREIVDKAVAATESARTLRLRIPGSLDVTMDREGNCAGSFTGNDEQPYEVLRKNDKAWLKPKDEAAYRNSKQGRALLAEMPEAGGKYMHADTSDSFTLGLATFPCQLGRPGALEKISAGEKATKGGLSEVGGRTAVAVKVSSAEDGEITVHVATEGQPHILRLDQPREAPRTMLLSDFDEPFTVPGSPPAAQTYDGVEAERLLSGL
ncbi:hypothetical protein ADL00_15890 [Streptomyces sp. AS58]|uniref:hypothetical protein n=1 Tax=Streptomyces sp. AS58 TaxID=1519489 RepID=UPI0006AF6342|nr:hypothetical protein [Streptomyces sp. AS58]KOV67300.1 hypothetical protein ADL00_15890 [Streptomyces sp. AS58]